MKPTLATSSVLAFVFLSFCLLIGLGMAKTADAKPSREQVINYVAAAKAKEQAFDLRKDFGFDFSHIDLSDLDLSGHYYKDFINVFSRIDFSSANLSNSFFGSGLFRGTNFYGADLNGAHFVTATLIGANFELAELDGTIFHESDLSETNFSGVDLSKADITGSDFIEANLSNAKLVGAKAEYANTQFDGATLINADLSGMFLAEASFQNADLSNANLSNANLKGADFSGATLTNTNFADAQLFGAKFEDIKGLSPSEERAIKGVWGRWTYVAINSIVSPEGVQIGLLVMLVLWATLVVVYAVRAISHSPRTMMVTISKLLPAAVMSAALSCFVLVFIIGGGSNVAQMAQGRLFWWNLWFKLWSYLSIAVLLCFPCVLLPPYNRGVFRAIGDKLFLFSCLLLTLVHLGLYAPDA